MEETTTGLEYEVEGQGEPVLLIHGAFIAGSFLPISKEPALDSYKRICYHRRGYAGSERHKGAFSLGEQAKDAAALLSHLGIQRAHLVGHSYGAMTALQLALDTPSLVQSLVLLEPSILTVASAEDFFGAFAPGLDLYSNGDPFGAVDSLLTILLGPGWQADTERVIPGAVEQTRRDAATVFEVELPAIGGWAFAGEEASRIAQPALYVRGQESPYFWTEVGEAIKSWMPQTEELVVPGSNHSLQMQHAKFIAEGVAAFLARNPIV